MYADDTHITYAGVDVNSIQLNLNHDLDNVNKWLISNKLSLNTAKTEFMLIGSRQKLSTLSNPLELSINNVPIGHVSSVQSLGVFIDENLRWQTHIDKLSKKVASGIGAIKRIRPFVPPPTLHYTYNALIQSRINKFLEIDLTIKVNVKRERRFDRPTVIFKFKMRSKICAYIQL